MTVQPGKADHQVTRKFAFQLEKIAVINDSFDHLKNVIGAARVFGDNFLKRIDRPVWIVWTWFMRRERFKARRQEAEQPSDHGEAFLIALGDQIRDAGNFGMDFSPT